MLLDPNWCMFYYSCNYLYYHMFISIFSETKLLRLIIYIYIIILNSANLCIFSKTKFYMSLFYDFVVKPVLYKTIFYN